MSLEPPPHLSFSPSIAALFCCFGATFFVVAGLAIQSLEFTAHVLAFLASSIVGSHLAYHALKALPLVAGDDVANSKPKKHFVVLRGNNTGVFDDP